MAAQKVIVWDEKAADVSLRRWHDMCEREGCQRTDRDENLLRAVFGASWYGTRFLFYGGMTVAEQLYADVATDPMDMTVLSRYLDEGIEGMIVEWEEDPAMDQEAQKRMMTLRQGHSRALLALIGWDVTGRLTQEQLENRLTHLACLSFERALHILMPIYPALSELMVLGMGRLAVHEMNYGSDLDLIFLHKGQGAVPDDLRRGISLLLNHCHLLTPAGRLYDVDTRLRPYGGAGALIASLASFREYHTGDRETWERQILCRCRLLYDPAGELIPVLEELAGILYSGRSSRDQLSQDIVELRLRVEKELGRPAGRVDIKRGYGGIMDVDFVSHYLQLVYGRYSAGDRSFMNRSTGTTEGVSDLCFAGTRKTLRVAIENDLCDRQIGEQLLQGYDFIKGIGRAFTRF